MFIDEIRKLIYDNDNKNYLNSRNASTLPQVIQTAKEKEKTLRTFVTRIVEAMDELTSTINK